jgi:hypothetical protein
LQSAAFEIDGDVIWPPYVVRNPDKLRQLRRRKTVENGFDWKRNLSSSPGNRRIVAEGRLQEFLLLAERKATLKSMP